MSAISAEALMRREVEALRKGATAWLTGKSRGPDRRVRKHSYDVDDSRAAVFCRIGNGSVKVGLNWQEDQMKVAREIFAKLRSDGGLLQPDGTMLMLTARDLWVHEVLITHRDFRTGRWDPSYATLMEKCGYVRETIARALRALAIVGLISWVRRTVKVDAGGEAGPQRKQISNAYYFDARRLIGNARNFFRELCEKRRRRAASQAAASPAKLPATPAAGPETELSKVLASLGRAVLAKVDGGASANPI